MFWKKKKYYFNIFGKNIQADSEEKAEKKWIRKYINKVKSFVYMSEDYHVAYYDKDKKVFVCIDNKAFPLSYLLNYPGNFKVRYWK